MEKHWVNKIYLDTGAWQACPRSVRSRIGSAHWGPKSRRHSVNGMFKCIPWKVNVASWNKLLEFMFVNNLHLLFAWKHMMQWINATASRERKLGFVNFSLMSLQAFAAKKNQLGSNTIHRKWPLTYVLSIHWLSCKLNVCLKLTFVFKQEPLLLHSD